MTSVTPAIAEPLRDRLLSLASPKNRSDRNATSAMRAMSRAYSTSEAPVSSLLEIRADFGELLVGVVPDERDGEDAHHGDEGHE